MLPACLLTCPPPCWVHVQACILAVGTTEARVVPGAGAGSFEEGTFLTVTLGVLLGLGLALLVSTVGGDVLGARLGFTLAAPQLTWALVSRTLLLIPLGLLAALPPAVVAARVSPLRLL